MIFHFIFSKKFYVKIKKKEKRKAKQKSKRQLIYKSFLSTRLFQLSILFLCFFIKIYYLVSLNLKVFANLVTVLLFFLFLRINNLLMSDFYKQRLLIKNIT